jgi:hypothetical protein
MVEYKISWTGHCLEDVGLTYLFFHDIVLYVLCTVVIQLITVFSTLYQRNPV